MAIYEININMKFNKVVKEDYSKIIGQIDSLKTNITQLISVNQDTNRTVKIADTNKNKSPITSKMKSSRTIEKDSKKRNGSHRGKENKKTESNESELTQKLWEKLVEVEKSNQEIKNSHLVLEQMLRVQRQKRKKLEKQLKIVTKQKNQVGTQKDFEPHRSQSFKIFTPQKGGKNECPKRKPSKTRDEGEIQSFLLGDCDDYTYSSPKKRNVGQIQIMELIQQVSRPIPFQRREETKLKLLDAVKRFIRK